MKPDFLVSFTIMGRFFDSLAAMPVQVTCNDRAALMGATQFAPEL